MAAMSQTSSPRRALGAGCGGNLYLTGASMLRELRQLGARYRGGCAV